MHALLRVALLVVLLPFSYAMEAQGDEKLAGIACRSVHLAYPAPESTAFYNEMTVERSAPGTYFMACGFQMGYFGIQELADGKKVVIFSVWDPGQQNDPKQVEEARRVKVLHQAADVRVGRFGNEGTGGQSFYDYDWQIGETCRFLVKSQPDGDRTAFSGYFWPGKGAEWKHLVTFSTPASGKALRGLYSFVEDFRRNRESTKHARVAHFGNGWVLSKEGQWTALTRARFTADGNPALNINAAAEGARFLLATGGETENTGVKLRTLFDRLPAGLTLPPAENPAPPAQSAP